MKSIWDPNVCEEAAIDLGIAYNTLRVMESKRGPGYPMGCSFYSFGNIIFQWTETTGDCAIYGFRGCFCLKNKIGNGEPLLSISAFIFTSHKILQNKT